MLLSIDTVKSQTINVYTKLPVHSGTEAVSLAISDKLVDVFSDEEFTYLRANEIVLIFKSAFERYTVSESKLLRYADRKRKGKLLVEFLNSHPAPGL